MLATSLLSDETSVAVDLYYIGLSWFADIFFLEEGVVNLDLV
jgi:hypothetical protein